ncbi:MAG: 3-deoxy-8-phosphooctulonate synthase [Candidatus Omnitrophica bacterium]|nr:3-deoxy-8-phosphooctulonate synthase [Candidatus Omnitrophota bacterium]
MKNFPETLFDLKSAESRKTRKQNPFFLIAGPCVIESENMALEHADLLKSICAKLQIPFVFKASYDKANRTSVKSFRGPGIKPGLRILKKVKQQIKVPVITDIHNVQEVALTKQVVDIIQIPALLSRQTDILVAAAKSNKIVNIKKGQFMAPLDMDHAVNKIEDMGNHKIIITERGTTFGYNNLVSDMRSIPIMHKFGYPIVFDATHSVQLPGAGKGKSLGQREFVETLALSSIAAGANALFLEVHLNPDKAKCDGPNMLSIKNLEKLLIKAKKIWEIVNV